MDTTNIDYSLEIILDIVEMSPREPIYRNRYDPLTEYNDSDFQRRFS